MFFFPQDLQLFLALTLTAFSSLSALTPEVSSHCALCPCSPEEAQALWVSPSPPRLIPTALRLSGLLPCAPQLAPLLHSLPRVCHCLAHFLCDFLILIIACLPPLGSSSVRAGNPVCLVCSCGPARVRAPGPVGLPGNIQQGKERGREGGRDLSAPVCQHQ